MIDVGDSSCIDFLKLIYEQTIMGTLFWEDAEDAVSSDIRDNSEVLNIVLDKERQQPVLDKIIKYLSSMEEKNVIDERISEENIVFCIEKINYSWQCVLAERIKLHLLYAIRSTEEGSCNGVWEFYVEQYDEMMKICEAVLPKKEGEKSNNRLRIMSISYDIKSLYGSDPIFNLLNRLADVVSERVFLC